MQKSEEMVNFIAEEIKDILSENIGMLSDPKACDTVKSNITKYLTNIQSKMSYPKLPEVKVANEGSFVTVNFFDNQGNRLETLGDMLGFMAGYQTVGEK